MSGTVATFHLDLMSIPCFIPAKGDKSDISVDCMLGQLPVKVTLISKNSIGTKKPNEQEQRYFYNMIAIAITKPDEHLDDSDHIESCARRLLITEFIQVVIDAINQVIIYCKYVKRHPNLRVISISDLHNQERALCNPMWTTIEGEPINVPVNELGTGVITLWGFNFLQDEFFGIEPMTALDGPELQRHFSSGHSATLSDQLLSDAQSAAFNDNARRAVLELAIAIEVFVKNSFFKREKVAGAAFEYLEDKGRENVKVIELLDGAALYAFEESFKIYSAVSYKHIDHIFRCRNKIAHRGETKFRDDDGKWREVDGKLLRSWWNATLEMMCWLKKKIDATAR